MSATSKSATCKWPNRTIAMALVIFWISLTVTGRIHGDDKKVVDVHFTPAQDLSHPDDAIGPGYVDVPANGIFRLICSADGEAAAIDAVRISFPPGGEVDVGEPQSLPSNSLNAAKVAYPIELNKVATWGVGLCDLNVKLVNGEKSIVRVNITGRTPFSTIWGSIGLLLLFLSFALAAATAVVARDYVVGGLCLTLGAVLFGFGAAILSQQFAWLPFAWLSVIVLSLIGWVADAMLFWFVRNLMDPYGTLSAVSGKQRTDEQTVESAPPAFDVNPAELPPARNGSGFFQRLAAGLSFAARTTGGSVAGVLPPGAGTTSGIYQHAQQQTAIKVEVTVSCPAVVTSEEEFTLSVHLPRSFLAGAVSDRTPRKLTVQLIAPGFNQRSGETLQRSIEINGPAPPVLGPKTDYHLTAKPLPDASNAEIRSVRTVYSSAGGFVGSMERQVGVIANYELKSALNQPENIHQYPELLHVVAALDQLGTQQNVETIEIPPANLDQTPDLTVWIQSESGDGRGGLNWLMTTPHPGIEIPDKCPAWPIDHSAKDFARALVDQISSQEKQAGREAFMLGLGEFIQRTVPEPFWTVLRSIGHRFPTSVLILTEDPYVPWELALMPEPRLDPTAPGFLAAQVAVGRWLVRAEPMSRKDKERTTFATPIQPEAAVQRTWNATLKRHPQLTTHANHPAFICGKYTGANYERSPLPHAETEVETLRERIGGKSVDASLNEVLSLLRSKASDLLHFACHGKYNPLGYDEGLALNDQETLTPYHVLGVDLGSPFVFLNACQVGSGANVLGTHWGMVEAFLDKGGAGVVAPLWSVRDNISGDVANRFYEQVAAGTTPAEALRRIRCEFRCDAEGNEPSLTFLAYLFFGHPKYKLHLRNRKLLLPSLTALKKPELKSADPIQSPWTGVSDLLKRSVPPNTFSSPRPGPTSTEQDQP